MMKASVQVLTALAGKPLATAESLTGGLIGAALTAVPGASAVYKGGIVSYCNEIKRDFLHVPAQLLDSVGAVSAPVAKAMAEGVRTAMHTDVAVSATGLAGPGGDAFGNPVGTVFLGYADERKTVALECHFSGDRESIRRQAVQTALELILRQQ